MVISIATQPGSSVVTEDNTGHASLSLSLSSFVFLCLTPSVQPGTAITIITSSAYKTKFKIENYIPISNQVFTDLFFRKSRLHKKITFPASAHFTTAPHPYTLAACSSPPSLTSRCCILCGKAGTRLWVLSWTDVFDSSAEAFWVLYMCGVDHLLPCSVYWTVKSGGHRPTWAPHSHQRGTHFMKNNTNNVTRAQNTSFPAALQIRFLLYYFSVTVLAARVPPLNTNPKSSSAFSKRCTEESQAHTNSVIYSNPKTGWTSPTLQHAEVG